MAVRDREIKKLILTEKGTQRLIQILEKFEYPNLIERALKLFQGLAICPANKKKINEDWFGMELLANFLRPEVSSEKDMIGYVFRKYSKFFQNIPKYSKELGNIPMKSVII